MVRRRVVIHAGLPKTGTSALQELLHQKREVLAASGTWFPDRFPSPTERLHRFFMDELRTDPSLVQTTRILSEASERDMRQVILSIEGVSAHLDAIRGDAAAAFAELTRDWDVEFVVVLRNGARWLLSMYRQCVIHPPISRGASNLERRYSTAMPFEEFAALSEIQAICSPERIEERLRSRFPAADVTFLRYEEDFIGGFADRCGLEGLISADQTARVNTMVPDSHLDILRRMNGTVGPRLAHQVLRAIVSTLTGGSSVHLVLYEDRLSGGLLVRGAALLLYHLVGGLRFCPNPPLETDAASFRAARRQIQQEALRRALAR